MPSELALPGAVTDGSRAGPDPGALRFQRVGKVFGPGRGWSPRRRSHAAAPPPHAVLADVDLSVGPGESVGIIGPNGAGKSTLLRLLAGVTTPTTGSVEHGGRLAAMIDLGLGFHPDLTGWENIRCSAAFMTGGEGVGPEVEREVARFSGIEGALDHPLRAYSSGMQARLGFAVAVHVGADVLVVDEVLAVGDREFQERCVTRINDLVASGTTLLFVSHDMALVGRVCQRAVQLRQGHLIDDGPVREVVERYLVRVPSQHRRAERATSRLTSFRATHPVIQPWNPIELEVTVDVGPVSGPLELGVDLEIPTSTPGLVVSSARSTLDLGAGRGRFLLRGTSLPYPGDSGVLRLIGSLVDPGRQRLLDLDEAEVQVGSTGRLGNPHLATECTWSMTDPVPVGTEPTGSRPGGSPGAAVARLRQVSKRYRQARQGRLRRPARAEDTLAVDRLDLDLRAGEVLGIMGPNGVGKSTVLRLLAGITEPDVGEVDVEGRVVAALELGVGFHPHLSGRQNLQASGGLLGLTGAELAARLDQILEFAGIGAAVDDEVRTYSAGMRARLGFALAIHASPDVLLLDELLAVGDDDFRRRALDAVRALCDEGAAVALVSHDLEMLAQVCTDVMVMAGGRCADVGPAELVLERADRPWWGSTGDLADRGVRIDAFDLSPRHVPAMGRVELHGAITVTSPSPTVRLEVAYRVRPVDPHTVVTADMVDGCTMFLQVVQPSGALAEPGTRHFTASIDRNFLVGAFDVVLSAIDGRDGAVVAETWRPVTVGAAREEGFPGAPFAFTWEVEPLAAPSGPGQGGHE
ncbi:ATP-binding cassette domain-containing protein [Iamia majanohamensis]|uniref:ATP-binding cassette domain-containing protein n=1 Tax=Iamia majanohamensis TaxID=467976 RepID=A0AAE9Y7S1_9ACTN|nr:ATP-binding cassette domain-containing protein [Iamia majanohamensis]WCO65879.1 ATP-binding cassette domain-containing protein [Iamia majanohamensis]